jgi:hypothetical protein
MIEDGLFQRADSHLTPNVVVSKTSTRKSQPSWQSTTRLGAESESYRITMPTGVLLPSMADGTQLSTPSCSTS